MKLQLDDDTAAPAVTAAPAADTDALHLSLSLPLSLFLSLSSLFSLSLSSFLSLLTLHRASVVCCWLIGWLTIYIHTIALPGFEILPSHNFGRSCNRSIVVSKKYACVYSIHIFFIIYNSCLHPQDSRTVPTFLIVTADVHQRCPL